MRTRRRNHIAFPLAALPAAAVALLLAAPPAMAAPACGAGWASASRVGKPAVDVSWRAELVRRTRLWRSVPKRRDENVGAIGPREAPALLVLRAARDRRGGCWLRVRLPSRPNHAAAWVDADRVALRRTRWRIVVARDDRTISLFRGGDRLRRFRVVVGAAPTPSPHGLFSIVGVWRSNPAHFLGSYVIPLTAHSNVLQEFGGGNGRVGIHGRGGSSLRDPLGSARSHGCVRLANSAIRWIVRTVGANQLPGIPVRVH